MIVTIRLKTVTGNHRQGEVVPPGVRKCIAVRAMSGYARSIPDPDMDTVQIASQQDSYRRRTSIKWEVVPTWPPSCRMRFHQTLAHLRSRVGADRNEQGNSNSQDSEMGGCMRGLVSALAIEGTAAILLRGIWAMLTHVRFFGAN